MPEEKVKNNRLPSFARRIGRTLRTQQKDFLANILPDIEIVNEFPTYPKYKTTVLEIGFGNGEHLAAYALKNPETLCIGAEPYMNGVATLLGDIDEHNIQNIRIYRNDVRNLIEFIPEKSLDKIFIICPDPWQKTKHKKRRLVNSEFLKLLSTKVCSEIIIVTDHLDYANWILKHATQAGFKMPSSELSHYTKVPDDWVFTKYQRRGIGQGSKIHYFVIN